MDAGFLFDGYPRTEAQAEDLTSILNELGKKVDQVINLFQRTRTNPEFVNMVLKQVVRF